MQPIAPTNTNNQAMRAEEKRVQHNRKVMDKTNKEIEEEWRKVTNGGKHSVCESRFITTGKQSVTQHPRILATTVDPKWRTLVFTHVNHDYIHTRAH